MAHRALEQHISVDITNKKRCDETGWGLYASRKIAAREAIISIERPLVISLDIPRLKDTCYECLGYGSEAYRKPETIAWEEDKKLQVCTGCHVVRYCSKECQTLSWKSVHKHECSLFARLHPNILPNNVRAVVQLLLLRKAVRLPRGEWDDFMNLESHLQQWESRNGRQWEDIGLMARGTKEYAETNLSEETLREVFGKLLVNCFTMVSPFYDPLGLVLHPLAALVNHSCNYNAFVRFDTSSHCLSIIALRPIARDEQIVVSYIDATNPRHVRQKELQDKYFFDCACSKCSDYVTKEEGVPQLPESSEHLLVEQRAFELLAAAQKDTSITGPIQKCQYGIHILRKTGAWPLHRQPLASLRQQLVVSLIAAGQIHLALVHAWIQYQSIDPKLLTEKHHPIRLVHLWLVIVLLKRIYFDSLSPTDLPIQKYGITSKSIIYTNLIDHLHWALMRRVEHDDGTFAQVVRHQFIQQAHSAVKMDDFLKEAEKLKACTTEILEKELVWGESGAAA
ncbi:hypothetical protein GJ744_003763 [Endocarpon pusillum]|uniref:Suppressor of anucleate metulae protein B n=1 Tax=Endocarpon pusillum TaxID=364733 RepID=A0A8H7A6G1_9EURO|nr:hypothetical protein GJ744_003763 [Endocarpon pusillum]